MDRPIDGKHRPRVPACYNLSRASMTLERPPNFHAPPVWQEHMDSVGVTVQEGVEPLCIFDGLGDVESMVQTPDESGTVHTLPPHRDELEHYASEMSEELGPEVTWKERGYWILAERFPRFGSPGSFG